jgi:N-acetylmuramoyl-L-alanine amidase
MASATTPPPATSRATLPPATTRATPPPATAAPVTSPATPPARPTSSAGSITSVGRPDTRAGKPLAGKVLVVDPGHNGGNSTAPDTINQLIWNGRENETCDTTGTETDFGYTEAQFNFDVAGYLAADLQGEGATVVLTRSSNAGVGPCVTERTAIGNQAHADAAISIHADGGPPTRRGFAVLEPVSDGINAAIIGPSQQLGLDIRSAFLAGTGEPVSSYDGVDGIQPRDDLGGLNLTTVPKVLVECANMRNANDAALLTTARWQQAAAQALAAGLTAFLAH